jgi:hypothetical protein
LRSAVDHTKSAHEVGNQAGRRRAKATRGKHSTPHAVRRIFSVAWDRGIRRTDCSCRTQAARPGGVITVAFIGYLVAGLGGATAAALGIFLPVYRVVVLLAPSYKRWAKNPRLNALVRGVTAAATGAIAGGGGGACSSRDLRSAHSSDLFAEPRHTVSLENTRARSYRVCCPCRSAST